MNISNYMKLPYTTTTLPDAQQNFVWKSSWSQKNTQRKPNKSEFLRRMMKVYKAKFYKL